MELSKLENQEQKIQIDNPLVKSSCIWLLVTGEFIPKKSLRGDFVIGRGVSSDLAPE